jgi:hypothetical protein
MILPTTTYAAIPYLGTFLRGHFQHILRLCAGISAVAFVPAAVAVIQDVVHPGLRTVSLGVCVDVQHLPIMRCQMQ